MNNQNIVILPTVEELKSNWYDIQRIVEISAKSCGRNPQEIKVIAVTKTHPIELIIRALKSGINVLGENYAQELCDKYNEIKEKTNYIPEWHFIGHLQTNKVKFIAPFVSMIHSVDSIHLAEEISKQAIKNNREIDILLQVNTSGEESKYGCKPEDIFSLAEKVINIPNLKVKGLMTIGSFSDDDTIVRSEFRLLKSLKDELIRRYDEEHFKHLSMGMTNDYNKAVEEGATLVRIGTAIFGPRHYF